MWGWYHSLVMLVHHWDPVNKSICFVQTLNSQDFYLCPMSQKIVKVVLLEIIEIEVIKWLKPNRSWLYHVVYRQAHAYWERTSSVLSIYQFEPREAILRPDLLKTCSRPCGCSNQAVHLKISDQIHKLCSFFWSQSRMFYHWVLSLHIG